jgi:hypothetical protein
VLVALGVAPGAQVQAMVIEPVAFSTLVASSDVVVHGVVVEVRSHETSGRASIESVVTLRVVEAYKGRPGTLVSFRVPGGRVGRYQRVVVGAPVFAAGHEVVLFLAGAAPALPVPTGLTQGVYRVSRGTDGRALVMPPAVESPGPVVRGAPGRRPIGLESLADQVRALAGAGR